MSTKVVLRTEIAIAFIIICYLSIAAGMLYFILIGAAILLQIEAMACKWARESAAREARAQASFIVFLSTFLESKIRESEEREGW